MREKGLLGEVEKSVFVVLCGVDGVVLFLFCVEKKPVLFVCVVENFDADVSS